MTAAADVETGDVIPSDLVTLTIDGTTVQVPKGTLIIRAAEMIGTVIPRFCDHPFSIPWARADNASSRSRANASRLPPAPRRSRTEWLSTPRSPRPSPRRRSAE